MQETQVRSLGREGPLEEGMAPTPVFLPGESRGQRSLAGCSPQGCEESDMTEQLSTHAYLYAGKEDHKNQTGFSEFISLLIMFSQGIFKY